LLLIFTLLRNPEGVAGDFYRRTHKRPVIRAPDVAAVAAERAAARPRRADFTGRPAVLRVTGPSVAFGGVRALRDVTLEVREGELVGLIGPNGAGKTTLVDAVSGFVGYTGRVELSGGNIGGLRDLADQGQSMLLIEHDMGLVLGICGRVVVLEFGTVIAEGPPETVRRDPRVIAAYLGDGVTSDPGAADAGMAATALADDQSE
jgi:ABC-type uncharacterized transport system ATPase subunit